MVGVKDIIAFKLYDQTDFSIYPILQYSGPISPIFQYSSIPIGAKPLI